MKTHSLTIQPILIDYKIHDTIEHTTVAEYYINEKPLADILHIKRDLQFSDTAFNMLFMLPENKISAQTQASIQESVKQFVGETVPENQFNSNRLVLYRCHCGSDYCGVISCILQRDDRYVIWDDIAFEVDDQIYKTHREYSVLMSEFNRCVFSAKQYDQAVLGVRSLTD